MNRKRIIRSMTFQPDGSVAVEYVTPATDLRQNGLEQNSVLLIPYGSDYDDEIDALMDLCVDTLEDALEDFESMEPWDLNEITEIDGVDDDDDDE